ncbi:MAG: V-type ATP synthase subunit B [Deinococcales bacterium]
MRADRVEGPLLVLEGFGRAAYGEVVEVHAAGRVRLGEVLASSDDAAVIELWDDTAGLAPEKLRVRLRGETLKTVVAEEMLGRVFDGLGRPRDGLPPPLGERRLDVHGQPINPAARAYPRDPIHTGVTAIDLLNTLVRGQKLPLLSGAGLPHNELAAQIALQAGVGRAAGRFAVVFAALGIPHDTASYFRERFESSGLLSRTALFLNLADDAPMERIVTPRVALTLAEFLAFERDYHVLVLLTDMTNYAEALRELSARKNEVPGRKGYPGYLYTDLASVYERCGRIRDVAGSLTQVPILSMPGDDITHPVPDLTGYITEGQVVLSRSLSRAGVYPPVDVPLSLSRLMKDGIGEGRTRADHAALATQLYASYAHVREVRNLATVIGDAALAAIDRTYLAFGERFEKSVLQQGPSEIRGIEESLDRGWDALSALPSEELTRLPSDMPAAYDRLRRNARKQAAAPLAGTDDGV